MAALMIECIACEETKPAPAPVASTSIAQQSEPEPAFALPDPDLTPLARVGEWVDRGRSKLPDSEVGTLDTWLRKAVQVPIEVRGESRKTLLDVGNLSCGYKEKMTCTFPAKLSPKAQHFVASTVVCIGHCKSPNKECEVVRRADWKIEPNTPRGQQVELPIDDGLLRECWEKGSEFLRIEAIGMSCVVPFPRQVRCAGEFNTCLFRCKGVESCEQVCDVNRTKCLSICGK